MKGFVFGMVGLVRTSNQFNGWGHALAFDGEIKGLGYTEIGTSDPKPNCIERNAQRQGRIFYIHPCTATHGTCLDTGGKERMFGWI